MELSGQHYTLTAVASGEDSLVGIDWKAWWTPQLVWTF